MYRECSSFSRKTLTCFGNVTIYFSRKTLTYFGEGFEDIYVPWSCPQTPWSPRALKTDHPQDVPTPFEHSCWFHTSAANAGVTSQFRKTWGTWIRGQFPISKACGARIQSHFAILGHELHFFTDCHKISSRETCTSGIWLWKLEIQGENTKTVRDLIQSPVTNLLVGLISKRYKHEFPKCNSHFELKLGFLLTHTWYFWKKLRTC